MLGSPCVCGYLLADIHDSFFSFRVVHLRQYSCELKKSAEGSAPYVGLREMGPAAELSVRRVQVSIYICMHIYICVCM